MDDIENVLDDGAQQNTNTNTTVNINFGPVFVAPNVDAFAEICKSVTSYWLDSAKYWRL